MTSAVATRNSRYVGRFAPSPTGPLHAGSVLAAVASWLDARAAGGRWLLRIEDIDTPRCDPAHAEAQIRGLALLGLEWDGPVIYQSDRLARYREVFAVLRERGAVFGCICSRKQLRRAQPGSGEIVYPGTCREGLPPGREPRTWRFRVSDEPVAFNDRLLGPQRQRPASDCGDFIIVRGDGLFAYQLVVVVDDLDQGVNQIVRGADLLSSTGRQILLQRKLGQAEPPGYLHLPLLCDAAGAKLSKQQGAAPVDLTQPRQVLADALQRLGLPHEPAAPPAMLAAALPAWDAARLPRRLAPADGAIPAGAHLAN